MPIVEELPDDFDISPEGAAAPGAAAPGGASASSDGAGLRRGFFNAPRPRQAADSRQASAASRAGAPAAAPGSRPTVSVASVLEAPTDGSSLLKPRRAAEDDKTEAAAPSASAASSPPGASSSGQAPHAPQAYLAGEDEDCDAGDLIRGLRARLRSAADAARERSAAEAGADSASRTGRLQSLLDPIRSEARWPTPHARSAQQKASSEIDVCLAELRAASNDARRLRGGEEKRAALEFRKAAEDAVERVRKVAEAAMPPDSAEEEHAWATVAAFHALPLTAKLRLLADERAAVLLLVTALAAGACSMAAVLLEVYTAWRCGMQCER